MLEPAFFLSIAFTLLLPLASRGSVEVRACKNVATVAGDARAQQQAPGETVELYRKGVTADDYNELIPNMTAGTYLRFDDGKVFVFKRLLGAGDTTFVVETDDGVALRIPKKFRPNPYFPRVISDAGIVNEFSTSFVELHRELSQNGVPVVGLDLARSHAPAYLFVERLKIEFTLKDYLEGAIPNETKKNEQKIVDGLIAFARCTWMYESIGDFAPWQMAWTGEKWVLFDMADSNQRLGILESDKNVFTPVTYTSSLGEVTEKFLGAKLYKKIRNAIVDEREKNVAATKWIKRQYSNVGQLLLTHSVARDEIVDHVFYKDAPAFANAAVQWSNAPAVDAAQILERPLRPDEIRFKVLGRAASSKDTLIYRADLLDGTTGFVEIRKALYYKHREKDIEWMVPAYSRGLVTRGSDFRLIRAASLKELN